VQRQQGREYRQGLWLSVCVSVRFCHWAVLTLRVHVDETHVCSSQRLLEIAGMDVLVVHLVLVTIDDTLARDALVAVRVADIVAQPCVFSTPIDRLVGLEGVGASTGKAEGWAAHGLEGDVAGEQVQISPRDLVAVLLLDGPEETAGLVEGDVVGPCVQGSESLLALAASTAAVVDTVGSR
jgi:hypothetical protein